jgi:hypothetical protein
MRRYRDLRNQQGAGSLNKGILQIKLILKTGILGICMRIMILLIFIADWTR